MVTPTSKLTIIMSHLLLTMMNKENTCASIVLHVKTLHVLARTGIGTLTHHCMRFITRKDFGDALTKSNYR